MTQLTAFLHTRITAELAALISVAAAKQKRRPADFVRIAVEKEARRVAASAPRKPRKPA